jgi:hypothetical protein
VILKFILIFLFLNSYLSFFANKLGTNLVPRVDLGCWSMITILVAFMPLDHGSQTPISKGLIVKKSYLSGHTKIISRAHEEHFYAQVSCYFWVFAQFESCRVKTIVWYPCCIFLIPVFRTYLFCAERLVAWLNNELVASKMKLLKALARFRPSFKVWILEGERFSSQEKYFTIF